MRWNYFATSLFLFPLFAYADEHSNFSIFFDTPARIADYTIERSISNENRLNLAQNPGGRTLDYPTKILRLFNDNIEYLGLSCAQVNEEIDKVLINKITKDKFTFTTYISCTYDPATRIATQFLLKSYFDPISDEAIAYLDTYIDQYHGSDLLGTALNFESAKGLIVSLNISVGMKKNPNMPPFVEYREDRSNFYFKNNYELQTNLVKDIGKDFFTDEAEKVLPFLDKWVFDHAGIVYKAILRDSNFALLQPERIFLMNNGEPIFVSPIKYYYAHNCAKYTHQHCLKQEL